MKKLILAAALLFAAVTTNTYAADVKVTPVVLQAFQATFFNARQVQWTVVDQMYKAEFTLDGEKSFAFFNVNDGTLVVTGRYLTVPELPRTLQRTLKAAANPASIIELFEVQTDEGLDYFATVSQDGKPVVLKAASAKWSVYKK